uniref:BTB domain-containing protein n=1 Tax=Syphacia muris TaxID=451379 RepID=A0A0N5AYF5_9BILA
MRSDNTRIGSCCNSLPSSDAVAEHRNDDNSLIISGFLHSKSLSVQKIISVNGETFGGLHKATEKLVDVSSSRPKDAEILDSSSVLSLKIVCNSRSANFVQYFAKIKEEETNCCFLAVEPEQLVNDELVDLLLDYMAGSTAVKTVGMDIKTTDRKNHIQ